jgi:hypothetical protein
MSSICILEDSGHSSINGMIEKCASLVLQFYNKIAEDEEMEDADCDDLSVDIQEEPPATQAADTNGPGDHGGDSGREEGDVGPFAQV